MKLTKKQQIEVTAKELFWKHGFKKVSIDEICKKANVSRKTFYTFYENKSALVIFILSEMTSGMLQVYREIMEGEKPFAQKMNDLLQIKYQASNQFSMEFVADFLHPDSEDILVFYTGLVQDSLKLMRDFFIDAQKRGEMNPGLDINFVMVMMQKVLEMCSKPDLLALFPDAETMSKQVSELLIYGIMPVNK